MWAVLKKEFKSYFLSPIGYIAVGTFLIFYSMFFYLTTIQYLSIDLGSLYYITARYGLMIIVPILTMRMFAEERKNGTEQLLLTSPKSITAIVLGKFFAAVGVVLITMIISIMYFIIISFFGTPYLPTTLVVMLGFLLLAMSSISFGMFVSSITENQIIAAIITIAYLIGTWFLPDMNYNLSGLSLMDKFIKFPSGLISITEIVALISFATMFVLFTIIIMQRRKSVK